MQKSGYAKSTAVRSYREVNTRARVSVSPLKWKAIISDGVVAWVVQLRTKTCNSNAVLLVDWRGNNKMTRSQSHTHTRRVHIYVSTQCRETGDRCQEQCCSVASTKLSAQYGRASRRQRNGSMWATRVSNGAETHTLLIFKHANATPTVTCSHTHAGSHSSLRETVSNTSSLGRQVRGFFSFAIFERHRDDGEGEAQRGTLLPFKVKETNAHVSRANR